MGSRILLKRGSITASFQISSEHLEVRDMPTSTYVKFLRTHSWTSVYFPFAWTLGIALIAAGKINVVGIDSADVKLHNPRTSSSCNPIRRGLSKPHFFIFALNCSSFLNIRTNVAHHIDRGLLYPLYATSASGTWVRAYRWWRESAFRETHQASRQSCHILSMRHSWFEHMIEKSVTLDRVALRQASTMIWFESLSNGMQPSL